MGLWKPDLFRSFTIGFLIGCAGLAASIAGDARAEVAVHATFAE